MCTKKKHFTVVLAILLLPPLAYAVDLSTNVQEMSHLGPETIGGLADVWGWYDAANAKYYALGCNSGDDDVPLGIRIVDATDPTQPFIVGTLSHGATPKVVDVMVSGDYAFATSQLSGPSEIWIYHLPSAIATPSNPPECVITLIDDIYNPDPPENPTFRLNNCHNVFLEGNLLFLAEMITEDDPFDPYEVAVIDVTNPAAPVLLDVWDYTDFDEDFVSTHDVFVSNDTAYVFCYGTSDIHAGVFQALFDRGSGEVISWKKIRYDPLRGDVENQFPEGFYECEGAPEPIDKRPFAHGGWVTQNGQYLVVGDEGPGGPPDCQSRPAPCLRVFDIDNFRQPGDPTRVPLETAFDIIWDVEVQADQYIVGPENIDLEAPERTPCPFNEFGEYEDCDGVTGQQFWLMGVHIPIIKGRNLYAAWYARGLQVLDFSDISDIRHVGYFDHGVGSNWVPQGDWWQEAYGVYPFAPDGYIYVSGDQGLYIYRYGYTGTLAENTTWRGDVYVYETLTVPANVTLTIEPGTDIHMFGDAVINVNGFLDVNGTVSDSVRFFALGPIPQPGDWQGIHFLNGSGGTLQYCAIRHAVIGIEMEDFSDVEMDNCLFKKNQYTGIDNYKGALQVTSSTFESHNDYGVYSYKAESRIESCIFKANWKYGVYCWYEAPFPLDSSIVHNCLIDLGGVLEPSSQYGILSNVDRMRISSSKIKDYFQGGIKLDNSNSFVIDCDLRRSGVSGLIGINAYNNSNPRLRHCNVSSQPIGVKASLFSLPHIGQMGLPPGDPGLCDFENCSNYYIRFEWPTAPSPVLMAENNFFRSVGAPDPLKFYGNVDYNPYITYDPFPRIEPAQIQPFAFELKDNYPNPFNPRTTISFNLEAPAYTVVEIYNIMGQKVKMLVASYLGQGISSIAWDGTDDYGKPASSGIYFYAIRSGDHFETKKMTLLR